MADPATAATAATATGALAGIFIFFMVLVIAIIIAVVLLFIFWIFMIVDVAKRDFKNESDKIVWILIVVLLGVLGGIIYYFAIKKPNKH
jgi:NADH:ubiquinone oxidoreductase subunit 6 (subunit J)